MTIWAFEAQESWLPAAIGMPCSAVEIDEDEGLLSLLFGETFQGPAGALEAERVVSMLGVWRVEHGDEIIAASGDVDDSERRARLARLAGKTLIRVEVSRPGFDLALVFSEQLTARCFPCDSIQYEEDPPEDDEVFVAWWVDGIGIPSDWEEANEAFFEEADG
jgi:hypothetical protein